MWLTTPVKHALLPVDAIQVRSLTDRLSRGASLDGEFHIARYRLREQCSDASKSRRNLDNGIERESRRLVGSTSELAVHIRPSPISVRSVSILTKTRGTGLVASFGILP
jgi:hypothetical protein